MTNQDPHGRAYREWKEKQPPSLTLLEKNQLLEEALRRCLQQLGCYCHHERDGCVRCHGYIALEKAETSGK